VGRTVMKGLRVTDIYRQRHHKGRKVCRGGGWHRLIQCLTEDVIFGSLIGFLAAWLVFRVYFPDPFRKLTTGDAGGEPRTVYAAERRSDGFMELNELQEERRLREEQPGEEQV